MKKAKRIFIVLAIALVAVATLAGCDFLSQNSPYAFAAVDYTCEVPNCIDETHGHNSCGLDNCTIIFDHAHNSLSCTQAGCTIEGEHTHCDIDGCIQTGIHAHNNCGYDNCTLEGAHAHCEIDDCGQEYCTGNTNGCGGNSGSSSGTRGCGNSTSNGTTSGNRGGCRR